MRCECGVDIDHAEHVELKRKLKRWPIVVTGFTGILAGSFSDFHADVEKVLGHSVFTHELASTDMVAKIKAAYKAEFLELAKEV